MNEEAEDEEEESEEDEESEEEKETLSSKIEKHVVRYKQNLSQKHHHQLQLEYDELNFFS